MRVRTLAACAAASCILVPTACTGENTPSPEPTIAAPTSAATSPQGASLRTLIWNEMVDQFEPRWQRMLQHDIATPQLDVDVIGKAEGDNAPECEEAPEAFDPAGSILSYCDAHPDRSEELYGAILVPYDPFLLAANERAAEVGDVQAYLDTVALLATFYADHLASEITRTNDILPPEHVVIEAVRWCFAGLSLKEPFGGMVDELGGPGVALRSSEEFIRTHRSVHGVVGLQHLLHGFDAAHYSACLAIQ